MNAILNMRTNYIKCRKTIDSVTTTEQWNSALRMVNNFFTLTKSDVDKLYTFWDIFRVTQRDEEIHLWVYYNMLFDELRKKNKKING